ncbi:hypothetical protein B0H14DRAFT_2350855, partial [Mycena olivaceomarginata]
LGKAGTLYARSLQQTHRLPKDELPDAALVFDALHAFPFEHAFRSYFVKHPAGLSLLMFSVAALVIHPIFRASHTYVDMGDTCIVAVSLTLSTET